MDDSSDLLYRLENGKKVIINGNRVYRVHLVLAMKEGSGKIRESFHHYNLILNKSGIIRIDKNEI
ncbi:MAG: hypothetical protein PF518_12265 [Spirochaetaceae bacterium]|nr:hypothetical protein [Spirochaetaceae bacterium]